MNNNYRTINKYEGLSLVEMLITLLIVGLVLLVVSTTLTALIKASAISSARTLVRDDTEYIFEILERYVQNSQIDEIFLYKVQSGINTNWGVSPEGTITAPPRETLQVYDLANDPLNTELDGTEIHFRPIGSDNWVCIAMYPGYPGTSFEDLGFIVKGTVPSQDPQCIADSIQRVYLNSDDVDVNSMVINVYPGTGDNYNFVIDLEVEPVHWVPGKESRFKPEYYRQLIVSTKKLTF